MNFIDIAYLRTGTPRQQKAWEVLTGHSVLDILSEFTPVLTGTIPLQIDIESSDLDIACYAEDLEKFSSLIELHFSKYKNYTLTKKEIGGTETILANFEIESQVLELFGQAVPVTEQASYRHMIVEYTLLKKYGEEFRTKIMELKKNGIKTEPAFAMVLGMEGNAYEELLKMYSKL